MFDPEGPPQSPEVPVPQVAATMVTANGCIEFMPGRSGKLAESGDHSHLVAYPIAQLQDAMKVTQLSW